ncbi:hypothetical protein BDZ94DRAFT_1041372 [Collybia nuda]|uniref:Rho-GAP domain-containing protein n=1 Tax=Collybia nuda TaxID=64659 RepID=A0A9P5YGJ6_9AGAR|nr:hypothetical protein BDZ94DRAFT_1041372 [Collybia nuda]
MPTGSEREPWASTQPHPTSHASSGRPPPAIWLPASNSSSSSAHQPANSHPGRISSDHPVPLRAPLPISISTSTTATKPTHSLVLAKPSPRSTSLPIAAAAMGQSFTKAPHASSSTKTTATPPAPPSSPSTAARGLNAAITGGIKLKRAFAARRKKNDSEGKIERSKSRDALLLQPHPQDHFRHGIQATPSSASSPAQVMSDSAMAHHRGAKPFSQLATQVFNKRSPKATPPPPQGPPPLPPKAEAQLRAQLRPQHSQGAAADHNRSSIIPLSPGISSAVSFMRSIGEQDREREKEDERERERAQEKEREREKEKEKERQAVLEKETEKEKEHLKEQESARQRQKEAEKAADAASKADMKDTWRKSDSTIGHHTIRPGATAGPRPSRPVSMAESLQSNHTIVPVNKRLSALVTDVDFGMPEEESERVAKGTAPEDNTTTTPTIVSTPQAQAVTRAPPTPPPNAQKRRSMSVNITSHAPFLHAKLPPAPASASVTELKYPSHSISEGMMPPSMSPTLSRETPSLSRTPANATGFIGPSSHGAQSTGHNIRGKLTAWTNATNSPAPSSSGHSSHGHGHSNTQPNIMNPYTTFPPPPEAYRSERRLPALPPQQQPTPSFRQTAISMTNSLAPAAGLAKRAVEKMGRAWGGLSSGSSSATSGHTGTGTSATSGYSSSGSTGTGTGTAPSSYAHSYSQSQDIGHELARTVSSQSSTGGSAVHHHIERDKKGRLRHIPKAASGSSIVSGNSGSAPRVPDAFGPPSGPVLGKRLRGPLRVKHGGGGGSGGVVFGKDLKAVVRETGVWVGKPKAWGGRWRNWDGDGGEGGGDVEGGEEAWRARRASVRRGQLKALEERRLPALVVRCAQHLLIWGVQEEGLFRYVG